jgi:hypothetical protein
VQCRFPTHNAHNLQPTTCNLQPATSSPPIFTAVCSIVSDAFEVLPKLVEAEKKLNAER